MYFFQYIGEYKLFQIKEGMILFVTRGVASPKFPGKKSLVTTVVHYTVIFIMICFS